MVEQHRLAPQELSEHYVEGHGLSISTGRRPIPFGWRHGRTYRDGVLNPGEFHLLTHGELNTPRWLETFDEITIVLDPRFVADVVGDGFPAGRIEFATQRSTHDATIAHYAEAITTTSIGGLIAVPFNSMYHATKWGLEGFCESMAFELKRFGIGMKTIEPGGMKTDFFTRSFDSGRHEAYDAFVERVMSAITDPKTMATYSTPDQIAEVVYEAATDGKDQLRYVAGPDGKATYATRLKLGDEAFRKAMEQRFFG